MRTHCSFATSRMMIQVLLLCLCIAVPLWAAIVPPPSISTNPEVPVTTKPVIPPLTRLPQITITRPITSSNAATMRLIWKTGPIVDPDRNFVQFTFIRSDPVSGNCILGSMEHNRDYGTYVDRLRSYSLGTGKLVWEVKKTSAAGPAVNMFGTPAVMGGSAFVRTGSGLESFDMATGIQRWKRTADSNGAPVCINGTLYFRKEREIEVLNPANGAMLWKMYIGSWTGDPVSDGVALYVSSRDFLRAYDLSTKQMRWQIMPPLGMRNGSPEVRGSIVYQAGGAGLYAVDTKTGGIKWKLDPLLTYNNDLSVANDKVYTFARNPGSSTELYCFNAVNGSQLWKTIDSVSYPRAPLTVNDVVIAQSTDRIFTYLGTNGAKLWSWTADATTGQPLGSALTPDGSKLLVITSKGMLLAFGPPA